MRYIGSFVLLLFVFASAGVASADYLSVNFVRNPCEAPYGSCDLQPYINNPGSPASGDATFPAMALTGSQWSYSFQTAAPYYWVYDRGSYYAEFNGGVFEMTGPGDLTFQGQITDGSVTIGYEATYAVLDFAGEWSNNIQASGSTEIYLGGRDNQWVSLDVTTAPEPTSIVLLGSAVAGLWNARKRGRT